MKKVLLLIFAIFFTLPLTGCGYCRNGYSGDYPDLYTVANESVLWMSGGSMQADFMIDPNIEILSTDDYGRILFKYIETDAYEPYDVASLVVMQSRVNDFVYYYEDFNYISKPFNSNFEEAIFTDNEIGELLKKNDWNKELNLEKCVKKQVYTDKEKDFISVDELSNNLLHNYNEYSIYDWGFLTDDRFGRLIYWVSIDAKNEEARKNSKYVVMLFQIDKTCLIFEPEDRFNCQEEFREFKQIYNWNKPN